MTCTNCNSNERGVVRVLETRDWNGMILRRRLCKACSHRWVTLEVPREEWLESRDYGNGVKPNDYQ